MLNIYLTFYYLDGIENILFFGQRIVVHGAHFIYTMNPKYSFKEENINGLSFISSLQVGMDQCWYQYPYSYHEINLPEYDG